MGTRDTYQRVLVQACFIAGDEAGLANALGAPVSEVVDWLLGERQCPNHVFLRAVDIVLADTRRRTQETRALLDQIRQRHRR